MADPFFCPSKGARCQGGGEDALLEGPQEREDGWVRSSLTQRCRLKLFSSSRRVAPGLRQWLDRWGGGNPSLEPRTPQPQCLRAPSPLRSRPLLCALVRAALLAGSLGCRGGGAVAFPATSSHSLVFVAEGSPNAFLATVLFHYIMSIM